MKVGGNKSIRPQKSGLDVVSPQQDCTKDQSKCVSQGEKQRRVSYAGLGAYVDRENKYDVEKRVRNLEVMG